MGRRLQDTNQFTRASQTAVAVGCGHCAALFSFHRAVSRIDACGFEVCSFWCDGCASPVVGVIDPLDDAYLGVCLMARSGDRDHLVDFVRTKAGVRRPL
jgi:hypothetical protein